MNKISIVTHAWHGDFPMELVFPSSWDLSVHAMAGCEAPGLTSEQIRSKLEQPIGTEPLSKLARGKKNALIMVDDLCRPTKAYEILPHVLSQLNEANLSDNQIRMIVGVGTHAPLTIDQIEKKIGRETLERVEVYNHNPYENTVNVGKTSRGTEVWINKEVMECDFKIAISSIVAHAGAGWEGGAKMIIPGVASYDTVVSMHRMQGKYCVVETEKRLFMEEAARLVGLDFIANALVNGRRDTVDLVCGDFVAAHRRGVEIAKKLYVTKMAKDCDIVVTNSYPSEDEAFGAPHRTMSSLREGGDMVVLAYCEEGIIEHYTFGQWGRNYGGSLWKPKPATGQPRAGRLFVLNHIFAKKDIERFRIPGTEMILSRTWSEALAQLVDKHGTKAKVAVYPCSVNIPEESLR
jgi:nickel-dependent lactate racemase